MRKKNILIVGLLVACLMVGSTLTFAQTANTTSSQSRLVANRAFVIDFGSYRSKMEASIKVENALLQKNKSGRMRGLPTEDYKVELKDWTMDKWTVDLNSSSSSVFNSVNSYITNVPSNYWKKNHTKYYDGQKIKGYDAKSTDNVLGVRIHFPERRQNCWAKVMPPFAINVYNSEGKIANENNGVVDNVGQIKSVSIWVKGRNYKNSVAVRLKDRKGTVREYHFGALHFDNWRELTWVNPNYIENPKDRIITRIPLYPRSRPFVKLDSIVVYRHMDDVGGDFVMYVKDIKLAYDKAVADDDKQDINDEAIWGILASRRDKKKNRELLKLAERKTLLEQEKRKLMQMKAIQ